MAASREASITASPTADECAEQHHGVRECGPLLNPLCRHCARLHPDLIAYLGAALCCGAHALALIQINARGAIDGAVGSLCGSTSLRQPRGHGPRERCAPVDEGPGLSGQPVGARCGSWDVRQSWKPIHCEPGQPTAHRCGPRAPRAAPIREKAPAASKPCGTRRAGLATRLAV